MTNGAPLTRYHAEIKITVEGKEARINIFADTLNEIYSDLAKISVQFDRLHSQAVRELDNAQLKANQADRTGAKPPKSDPRPVCASCGSRDSMELVRWADKKTQEARSAWKCQACNQWHFPNGNKP
jgi:hypothetical protein